MPNLGERSSFSGENLDYGRGSLTWMSYVCFSATLLIPDQGSRLPPDYCLPPTSVLAHTAEDGELYTPGVFLKLAHAGGKSLLPPMLLWVNPEQWESRQVTATVVRLPELLWNHASSHHWRKIWSAREWGAFFWGWNPPRLSLVVAVFQQLLFQAGEREAH